MAAEETTAILRSKRWSWVPVRLHPYNRQLIFFGRWRQDYAPANGWLSLRHQRWDGTDWGSPKNGRSEP